MVIPLSFIRAIIKKFGARADSDTLARTLKDKGYTDGVIKEIVDFKAGLAPGVPATQAARQKEGFKASLRKTGPTPGATGKAFDKRAQDSAQYRVGQIEAEKPLDKPLSRQRTFIDPEEGVHRGQQLLPLGYEDTFKTLERPSKEGRFTSPTTHKLLEEMDSVRMEQGAEVVPGIHSLGRPLETKGTGTIFDRAIGEDPVTLIKQQPLSKTPPTPFENVGPVRQYGKVAGYDKSVAGPQSQVIINRPLQGAADMQHRGMQNLKQHTLVDPMIRSQQGPGSPAYTKLAARAKKQEGLLPKKTPVRKAAPRATSQYAQKPLTADEGLYQRIFAQTDDVTSRGDPAGYASKAGKQLRAAARILLGTGVRNSELLELRWKDIHKGDNWEGATLDVRGTKTARGKRTVPFLDWEPQKGNPQGALREWIEAMEEAAGPGGPNKNDLLFPHFSTGGKGQTLNETSASNKLRRFISDITEGMTEFEINKAAPHDFRKILAQRLLRDADVNNMTVPEMARMMGHTEKVFNRIYAAPKGSTLRHTGELQGLESRVMTEGSFRKPLIAEGQEQTSATAHRYHSRNFDKVKPEERHMWALSQPGFMEAENAAVISLQRKLGIRPTRTADHLEARMGEATENIARQRGELTVRGGEVVRLSREELASIRDGDPKFSALTKTMLLPENAEQLKGILKSATQEELTSISRMLAREAALAGNLDGLLRLEKDVLQQLTAMHLIVDRHVEYTRWLVDRNLLNVTPKQLRQIDPESQAWGEFTTKKGVPLTDNRQPLSRQDAKREASRMVKQVTAVRPDLGSAGSTGWWKQVEGAFGKMDKDGKMADPNAILKELFSSKGASKNLDALNGLTFELLFAVGIFQSMPAFLSQGKPNASN